MILTSVEHKTKKYKSAKSRKTKYYNDFSEFIINKFDLLPSLKAYNLTISTEKKFVWFRVAKVATRTTMKVLTDSKIDIEAEHLYRTRYPVKRYNEYFKFAFVRNPWERLVSCYLFFKRRQLNHNPIRGINANMTDSFESFVEFVETRDLTTSNTHFRLQSSLIDLNNIDYLGRFENFEQDLTKVLGILNIEHATIPHLNKTTASKKYRIFYNEDLIKRVHKLYKKDISIFNYHYPYE